MVPGSSCTYMPLEYSAKIPSLATRLENRLLGWPQGCKFRATRGFTHLATTAIRRPGRASDKKAAAKGRFSCCAPAGDAWLGRLAEAEPTRSSPCLVS